MTVYVSDARRIDEWLTGSATEDGFAATSEDGDAEAKGELNGAAVTGTIELPDGKSVRYTARRATATAGLYDLTVSSEGELLGLLRPVLLGVGPSTYSCWRSAVAWPLWLFTGCSGRTRSSEVGVTRCSRWIPRPRPMPARWSASTFPRSPAGCTVTSARLCLHAASYKSGRTLKAFRLASSWTEGEVRWRNQPATSGAAATATSGSGYREWLVTSQVQSMYVEGNFGFVVRDGTEDATGFEQGFHSREKKESPPRLVITFG